MNNQHDNVIPTVGLKEKFKVDKDYLSVTRHPHFFSYRLPPVELFSVVCNNLVAGMKIAVKVKDDDLSSRFWIVDVFSALANLFAWNGPCNGVSSADSQKMAKDFAPVIPLFKRWENGHAKYEEKTDFQTGRKPLSFAGELHKLFVWLYDHLMAEGYDPVAAAHPILFMPLKKENNGETTYSFMSSKFHRLLLHCKVYRRRHPEPTEIDKLFQEEMKKPANERFFNLDDDEDEHIFDSGDEKGATERSRLKAYLHYRQLAYRLHTKRINGHQDGFIYVRDELSNQLQDAKKAILHKYHEPLSSSLPFVDSILGSAIGQHSWFDLLYDLLNIPWLISYRDYCVEGYDEEAKACDDYHDDDGWPYFDRSENIPEHDICIEVRKKFAAYLETLAALAFCVQSSVYAKLSNALEQYEECDGVLAIFRKGDTLKKIIETIKETINRLEMEIRLYKSGRAILVQFDNIVEEVTKRIDKHDKNSSARFDLAQQSAEKLCAKQDESLTLAGTINENTLMAVREARNRSASHKVSLAFSRRVQQKCFNFWIEDRADPTLVNGHKLFRLDSFERRKLTLAKMGINDVATYSTLIDRYMKRTQTKIPNTKRKMAKKRKADKRNGKRKTASKKRKRTPSKRNR